MDSSENKINCLRLTLILLLMMSLIVYRPTHRWCWASPAVAEDSARTGGDTRCPPWCTCSGPSETWATSGSAGRSLAGWFLGNPPAPAWWEPGRRTGKILQDRVQGTRWHHVMCSAGGHYGRWADVFWRQASLVSTFLCSEEKISGDVDFSK